MADYPQWKTVASQLPPTIDDSSYDALRNGFFENQLWPSLVRGGARRADRMAAYQQFLQETRRPGKSDSPKMDVAVAAAKSALAKPVGALAQVMTGPKAAATIADVADENVAAAEAEAARQGEGTGLANFAGFTVGSLPYMVPMGIAGRVAGAAAGLGRVGMAAAEGAAAGGAYEAAAARPGERLEKGAVGAAVGGVMGAGVEKLRELATRAGEATGNAAVEQARKLLGAGPDRRVVPTEQPQSGQSAQWGRPAFSVQEDAGWANRQLPPGGQPRMLGPGGPQPPMPQPPQAQIEAAPVAGLLPGPPRPMPGRPPLAELPAPGETPMRSQGAPVLSLPDNPPFLEANPRRSIRERIVDAEKQQFSGMLATVPESPATIGVQVDQLKEGLRRVVMFPEGTPVPDRAPKGLHKATVPGAGTFLFDPEAINPKQIAAAVRDNRLPEILGARFGGMGAPDKSALGKDALVVVTRNDLGIITQETVTDAANLARTIEQSKKLGTYVNVETPDVVLARRAASRGGIIPEEVLNGQAARPANAGAAGEGAVGGAGADLAFPQPRQPKAAVAKGSTLEILVPGTREKYPAVYEVRELDDVYASHSGKTFQRNPEYRWTNDRDYNDPRNQQKVLRNVELFDPRYLINDSSTASGGPPIIDADGNVMGGNSRSMTLDRAYDGEAGLAYKAALEAAAPRYGLDQGAIRSMRRPVLVRRLLDEGLLVDEQASQKAITAFNPKEAAELTMQERAVADARKITDQFLREMDTAIRNAGDDATLADALRGPSGDKLAWKLVNDGVIDRGDIPIIFEKNERLTQIGRDRIQYLMLGRILQNTDVFAATPAELRGKLERIAAPLGQLAARPDWDLTPTVRSAVDLMEKVRNSGMSTDEFLRHGSITAQVEYGPEVLKMAEILKTEKPSDLAKMFRDYAAAEQMSRPGEATMTMFGEPLTREQAWGMIFGGDGPIAATGTYTGGNGRVIPLRDKPTGLQGSMGGEAIPGLPEDVLGATWDVAPGKAASVVRGPSREIQYHEAGHRMIIESMMPEPEVTLRNVNPEMADALQNALPNLTGGKNARYSGHEVEETVTLLHTAIRFGDDATIDEFVRADGSKEDVKAFSRAAALELQKFVALAPEGPQKNIALRKLQDIVRRSRPSLQDLKEDVALTGGELKVEGGDFFVKAQGSRGWKVFEDRESLVKWLDDQPWIDAPDLAPGITPLPGTPGLPPMGGPGMRFATAKDPVEPARAPRLGVKALSFWMRPALAWTADVAKLTGNPQLYRFRLEIDNGLKAMEREVAQVDDAIHKLVTKYKIDHARRHELGLYQIAQRLEANDMQNTPTAGRLRKIAANMEISDKERKFLDEMGKVTDRLFNDFGIDLNKYSKEYISIMEKRVKDPDYKIRQYAPSKDFEFFAEEIFKGQTRNFETDYFQIMRKYVRSGYWKKHVYEPWKKFSDEINLTETRVRDFGEDVIEKYGLVKNMLQRDADFVRGIPDESQKVIESVVARMIESANDVIGSARAKAPAWAKGMLKPIDMPPDEALRKFVTLQYAGSMGFRFGLVARNMTQAFLAMPMMDSDAFAYGLAKGFSKSARELADKFGVLATEGQMSQFLAEAERSGISGKLTEFAQKSLEPQRWSDNATRTAVFMGFHRQVGRAVKAFKAISQPTPAELDGMIRQSSMVYLDEPMAQDFASRIAAAATDKEVDQLVGEIAARLTETSQWSFTRGAQAGAYKIGFGRLFGQFGTWPTNFVEYTRRILFNPRLSPFERARTATKFIAMQTALFKGGEAVGVDMAGEVFLSGAGYSGSPLASALVNTPAAVARWDERGDEARSKAVKPLTTLLPGAIALRDAYRALMDESDDTYLKVLKAQGLMVMDRKAEKSRLHQLLGEDQ